MDRAIHHHPDCAAPAEMMSKNSTFYIYILQVLESDYLMPGKNPNFRELA
jgi:hypothetical protein